ncbi:hypothetical protein [Clostridium sp.]|uniref:hypothetical protein n=1 Tax=Clostridium sp. TaxID=1506 RepID=UPI0032169747
MDLTKASVIVGKTPKGECTLADDGSYNTITQQQIAAEQLYLPSYDEYELVIIRGELKTPGCKFKLGYTNLITVDDIDITAYGDRILDIKFKYPVNNIKKFTTLDVSTGKIKKSNDTSLPCESADAIPNYYKILTNFFCMFNGELSYDVSNNFNNWFNGFFLYKNCNRFKVSDDGKSLVIQSNFASMPHGNHLLAVADQRYQVGTNVEGNSVIDKNSALTVFNEEVSVIPSIRVPFSVGDRIEPTVPISVNVLSPISMFIKFNNPVMEPLKSELPHAQFLKVGNQVLKITKTVRATNDYKELLIYLDSTTPLQPSASNQDLRNITIGTGTDLTIGTNPSITDGAIFDAWGMVVQSVTIEDIYVPTIRPTITNVYQDKNPINIDNTVINVQYSTSMVTDNSINSITTVANYTLVDFNNQTIDLISAQLVNINDSTASSIKTSEVLPTGWYTLNVINVTDTIGGELDLPNPIKVYIEDITVPEIEEIIATNYDFDEYDNINPTQPDVFVNSRNNVMVVKFKTPMRVEADGILTAEHAADNAMNYRLMPADGGSNLIAKITPITDDNRWFRYVLSDSINKYKPFFLTNALGDPTSNPQDTPYYNLFCGYNLLKTFRYITNTAGNVLPFCDGAPIRLLGTRINYKSGIAVIEDSETIKLTISVPNNEVFKVNKGDFKAWITSSPNTPLVINTVSIDPDNSDNIIIKVKSGQLTADTSSINVSIELSGNTTDIFGEDIYCGSVTQVPGGVTVDPQEFSKGNNNLINNIASQLESISLVSLTDLVDSDGVITGGKIAGIRLSFAGKIVKTSQNDFIVLATSLLQPTKNDNCTIVYAAINVNIPNAVDVYCEVDKNIEPSQLRLSLSTNDATNIITQGENGVKISRIASTNAVLVNSTTATFKYEVANLLKTAKVSYGYACYGDNNLQLGTTVTPVPTIINEVNNPVSTQVVLPLVNNIGTAVAVKPDRFKFNIGLDVGTVEIDTTAAGQLLFQDLPPTGFTVTVSVSILNANKVEILFSTSDVVDIENSIINKNIRFIPNEKFYSIIGNKVQYITNSAYYTANAEIK